MMSITEDRAPGPEEWLLSALMDMVLQHCGTNDKDKLDSWALSANAEAMRLLAEAGLIEIESEFSRRVFAHVLPAAQELETRIEAARRKERIREARQRLGSVPNLTPEQLAHLYNITLAELCPDTGAENLC